MAAEHVALLGQRISQLRSEKGLTQNQLADLIPGKGTDGNQVSKWERGVHRPSDDTLEHIAAALGVSVGQLMLPAPTRDHPALNEIVGDGTQLDRIEAKLDRVLELLGATPLGESERLTDEALVEIDLASAPARPARGRRARQSG